MRRRGAGALLLLCTLLGSGCYGSESTNARATSSAITKDSYIAKANEICTRMNEEVDNVPDPGEDPEQFAHSVDQVAAIVKKRLTELRSLPAPDGDEAVVRAVWTKVDTMLFDLIAMGDAARDGNEALYNEHFEKFDTSSSAANAAAMAYGLTVCGEEAE